VSTVALNMRSQGGPGDTKRTFDICARLVGDHTDMVVKGLSWALRELVPHDADALRRFLAHHHDRLHARVIREVTNKLKIGLKNPRRAARKA
jgi:3-methyladenine DNA glycosylase AlkD